MPKEWALDDREQLHKEANQELDENLDVDEPVRAIIRGQYDSAIIATDRRIFVFKKGWLSGVTGGRQLSSWDYRNVSGIHYAKGMMGGVTAVIGPGGEWSTGQSNDDAIKASNAVRIIKKDQLEQAQRGVAAMRSLVAAHADGATTQSGAVADADPAEQLRKLADLRDAGILTEDEFASKKSELLARI